MKVLAINKFYYLKGGSETYFFELNKLLEGRQIQVIPFSMKDKRNFRSKYEEYFINNVDYNSASFLQKIKYSQNILYSFEANRKLRKIIGATKPDIAHLHIFQHQFSPSILKELKQHNLTVINTVHDLKPLCPTYKMLCKGNVCEKCFRHSYYHCLSNKCSRGSLFASAINTLEMYLHLYLDSYRNIDVFITPSLFYKNKFIAYGYDESRVVHLPNFIDIEKYAVHFNSNNYFIYFGRLSEEKGILTLMRAMKNVKGANLIIAGDGPQKEALEKYRCENNSQNVTMIGNQSGKELANLIKNSKFTVLPSEWYENSPLSILESMAYGKPVIGSNIGGIPELIEDKKTGLIFTPGDHESLARQINSLLDNPKAIESMGKEARKTAETKYNKDLHIEKLLEIYEKARR